MQGVDVDRTRQVVDEIRTDIESSSCELYAVQAADSDVLFDTKLLFCRVIRSTPGRRQKDDVCAKTPEHRERVASDKICAAGAVDRGVVFRGSNSHEIVVYAQHQTSAQCELNRVSSDSTKQIYHESLRFLCDNFRDALRRDAVPTDVVGNVALFDFAQEIVSLLEVLLLWLSLLAKGQRQVVRSENYPREEVFVELGIRGALESVFHYFFHEIVYET